MTAAHPRRWRSSGRRMATTVVALLLVVLGIAPPSASAHARLVSSSPVANAVLATAPTELTLTFDEPVELSLTTIEVFTEAGEGVELGAMERRSVAAPAGSAAADSLVVSLPPLDDGVYVVTWRTSSADSHVISGAFAFQVGAGKAFDAGALIDKVRRSAGDGGALPSGVDRASRLLSMVATVVLLGGAAVACSGSTRLSDTGRTRRVLGVAAVLGVVAAGAVLGSFALRLNPGWSGLSPHRLGHTVSTRTGTLYVARIAAAGLGAALIGAWSRRTASWWQLAAVLTASVTLISFSATGHPSAERPGWLWMTVDLLHLSAVCWWVGGLVLFSLDRAWFTEGATTLERYSRWTAPAVIVVVATGLAQTWNLAGSWDDISATAWGRYLLAKVAGVVVLLTLGGVSRWMLRHVGALSIRRNVITEAAIGVVIVLGAALMIGHPPRNVVAAVPFSATVTSAGVVADIAVGPGAVGANEIHVVITPPGGNLRPVVNATARATPLDGSLATGPIPLDKVGPNHYSGSWVVPSSGRWKVELLIDVTATNTVSLTTVVTIP